MSLQQHTTEETSAHLSPATAAETLAAETPRYDSETVQQIIALAGQMQARHRETLSPGEIVELGREVGVAPEFVRRALAQVEGSAHARGKTKKRIARWQGKRSGNRVLTRQQKAATVLPALLYALLVLLPFSLYRFPGGSLNWLVGILPALLAFGIGAAANRKRLGALGGALLGFATLASYTLPGLIRYSSEFSFGEILPGLAVYLSYWAGGGALLGISGAVARQFAGTPRDLTLGGVRVVAEPAD